MTSEDLPKRPEPGPLRNINLRPNFKIGPLGLTLIVLAVLALILLGMSEFWTDVLWFNQLKFSQVFWTQWIARISLFLVGTLLIGAIVGVNLWLAFRSRKAYTPVGPADRNLEQYRRQIAPLRKLLFWVISLAAGIFFGVQLAGEWQTVLMFLNASPFGKVDPEFKLDISFYIFTLPFLRLLVSTLLTGFGIALGVTVVTGYLYGGISISPKFQMVSRVRIHVGVLAALLAVVGGGSLWLDRYSALISDGARFSGAGYTSVNAGIPASAILAGIAVVIAGLFLFAALKGTWRLPLVGLAVMLVAALVVGVAYPAIVQRFTVEPNAQQREAEYISRNIAATLDAYGLDKVVSEPYQAKTETQAGQLRQDTEATTQIRLWDPTVVDQTFRQYQQSRQYYDFARVLSVDRYELKGQAHDTIIAVRELNLNGLGQDQRTWVNEHTVYTHGYGVVAAYGNQTAADGRPRFFEQGVPSSGLLGNYEQRIYFGQSSPRFSIVGAPEGTAPWEFDYPDDKADNQYVQNTFKGDGGPKIGSFFNKLLFALKFQDMNILFSDRVTSQSQILYNRNPLTRVAQVAPFLTLDGRVYPAVVDMDDDPKTPARVVWIVDGYTTSNSYPYSARQRLDQATQASNRQNMVAVSNQVNYMRNSVKAVVDAYDGSVKLFRWDNKDPVLKAWMGIFPGVITPTEKISGDLMSHFRYPEDMFKVQRELLTRYHVRSPGSFYQGNDFWAIPNDPVSGEAVPQPPFYMTLKMPGQKTSTFSLTSAFIPGGQSGRQILTGFMAANADAGRTPGKIAENYGEIRLIELPRGLTVPGPGQVQNIFNANFKVSTELNLLQQGGSQVLRGNLLTLPVGGGLLYVQPIYTQSSSGTKVPLLHRVLVAFGENVGFAPTLQGALDQVFKGDSGAKTGEGETPKSDPPKGGEKEPSAQEKLRAALADANKAIKDANAALAAGNWADYGKAQDQLNKAIERALKAEAEASGTPAPAPGGTTPSAPTPAPTPSGTVPTPAPTGKP